MASFDLTQKYEFSSSAKRWAIIMILLGIATVAFGFMSGEADRTFANLLLNSYYMTGICVAGLFFIAVQFVANAGWSTSLIRVPSAFSTVLPWAGLILVAIVGSGLATGHLYQNWANPALTDHNSPEFSELIKGKSGYLNTPFFMIRIIGFLIVWSLFVRVLRKYSLNEDLVGGLVNYNKSIKISAIFLVVFGFTSAIFAFDIIMSLEAKWFSTMFAWYNFAALWVCGLATMALTIILLKEKGYFGWVNESQMHDLGKFIFAFSIFWTYVWFSQFLLIYYANLPEEAIYFQERWTDHYFIWFCLNIVINFVAPVLILMSRDAKRNFKMMKIVTIIILCGHWLDYYMMIMPGTMGEKSGFGIIEIGTTVGFVGTFAYLMLSSLSRVPLVPKNHPFLNESLHHEI